MRETLAVNSCRSSKHIDKEDGGGSGTQKLVITTPAGSAADQYQVDMPLDGILFKTDMHLTISNVTSVTVFVTPITADTDNG